jgi:Fe-S cluster biogenesis protein NfuA
MNDGEFQGYTQAIEQLLQRVGTLSDENARGTAIELLQSLMDLHGAAFARIVEVLSGDGDQESNSLAKLGKDPLLCGLFVLYGVHPVPVEERVKQAIERVKPQLAKRDLTIALLAITDGIVRIKVDGVTDSGGASAGKARELIEQEILEAAPEVTNIGIEGLAPSGFIPINMIHPASKEANSYEESTA